MTKHAKTKQPLRRAVAHFLSTTLAFGFLIGGSIPAAYSFTTNLTVSPDVVEIKPTMTNQAIYPHSSFVPGSLPVVESNTQTDTNGNATGADVAMTFSTNAVQAAATAAGYTVTQNTVLCALTYEISGFTSGNGGFTVTGFDNTGTQASPILVPDGVDYSGSSYAGIYFNGSSTTGATVLFQGPPLSYTAVSPSNQPAPSTTVRSLSTELDISAFGWSKLAAGNLTIMARAVGGTNTATESVQSLTLTATIAESSCSAPTNYTVNFDANQGSGSMSGQSASTATALTSNSFTRSGFTFSGWNTAADGSGTAYSDGASYAFTSNLTLYAQWTVVTPPPPPAPTPYTGPIPVKLDVSCVPSTGGKATLSGERLAGITAATVDGKKITVSNATSSSVDLEFPALAPGTYSIRFESASGILTQQDGLRVCATSTSTTPTPPGGSTTTGSGDSEAGSAAPERLYVYKRFTNYRGDRGGVVDADRKAITDFINANPGLTHVTCVGSTSGVPALETDPALATARADNACDIVKSLVPGVTTRIAINTGLGVGQFYRAVTLFGKGTKSE